MIALMLFLLAPRVAVQAHYLDAAGQSHQLELWRDGARLRRDSDEKLQIFVEGDRWLVLDRAQGRFYRAGRGALAHIGSFPDFLTLSSLARPPQHPRFTTRELTAAGPCRWIAEGQRRLCWSEKWQLALIITQLRGDIWQEMLRVDRLSTTVPAGIFQPATSGLVEMDLDRDLSD